MPEYKCKTCGKIEQSSYLPYQWASIHQELAGEHDGGRRIYEEDYCLCPDCRQPEQELVRALKEFARKVIQGCWDCSVDAADIHEWAEDLGLVELHTATLDDVTEENECEVGEDMYIFSDTLKEQK